MPSLREIVKDEELEKLGDLCNRFSNLVEDLKEKETYVEEKRV